MFNDKVILITGGTGSWGKQLVKELLANHNPMQIRIFSRNENSQVLLERELNNPKLKFIIGDIRDYNSILKATKNVDYVFSLAALKHVPVGEIQPTEFVYTNINGTINVKDACLENKVQKMILVSTDKACSPINNYGASKFICEKIISQANQESKDTKFCIIRAGNVLGSNGSVIPFFIDQIKRFNKIPLTSFSMTRFFLTLPQAIKLLLIGVEECFGGEILVMNMPSFYIKDLAEILIEYYGNDKTIIEEIGLRPGEKLHEVLINEDELPLSYIFDNKYYVILPQIKIEGLLEYYKTSDSLKLQKSFMSNTNISNKEELEFLLKEGKFL